MRRHEVRFVPGRTESNGLPADLERPRIGEGKFVAASGRQELAPGETDESGRTKNEELTRRENCKK